MNYWFILLEYHKKLVEYISNCCNKSILVKIYLCLIWSLIFLYVLLYNMEFCFAGTSTKKYSLRPSNCSTILYKAGARGSHLDSMCSKNLWAGRPSFLWTSSLVFRSGSRQLKPYIQTNIYKLIANSERSLPNTWRHFPKAL